MTVRKSHGFRAMCVSLHVDIGDLKCFVMYRYKFKYEKKCTIVLGFKHSKDDDLGSSSRSRLWEVK
jgi:hypothetical protein